MLISIGVVSDCGKTFYAENANVQEELYSDFVIETVVPLLEGGEALMPYFEISEKLKQWIESFDAGDQSVKLWTDAPYFDWLHIEHLFKTKEWPRNLMRNPFALSFLSGTQDAIFKNAVNNMFRSNPSLRRHHALDDAIANCHAFSAATIRRY